MTTPIEKQQKQVALPAQRRDWCCGTAITGPHAAGCAYEPQDSSAAVPEPLASDSQPESVPAAPSAVSERRYGFTKAKEIDLELPSGAFVRVRKLRKMQVIDLKVMDIRDGFAPELLKDINGDDPERAALAHEEALRAVVDPETSDKVFAPINRVVAAAVICPTVVLDEPTTDEQINVREIEIDDKMAIFEAVMPDELKTAALGEQLAAIKSVREEPEASL
jgi:hypothetical protein